MFSKLLNNSSLYLDNSLILNIVLVGRLQSDLADVGSRVTDIEGREEGWSMRPVEK